MSLAQAIILAIVEGITEFLPISSTGHMIITSSLMGIAEDDFTKTFTVSIQFGAILSVIFLYWKRFFQSIEFYMKLLVAFLPAVFFGLLLGDLIDAMLGSVVVVACSLLAGGIVLIFIDKLVKQHTDPEADEKISYPSALKIGLFQVIAMVPGVSRSAATIIGGMVQGLSRKTAAEFSFFLAVPTMFAATVYKLYDFYKKGLTIETDQITLLIVGNVVAFIVAVLAIRSFINALTKYGLRIYGYYRILVGLVILILLMTGTDLQIIE